jgi:hypothetical protein
MGQGQPRQKVCEIPSQWKKSWALGCAPVIPDIAGSLKEEDCSLVLPGQKVRPISNTTAKKAGGAAQVVECLPIKHKAMSSKPSTTAPPPKKFDSKKLNK